MRSLRVLVAALVVGSVLMGGARQAAAHETARTLAPVIDGFRPAVDGVEATVQASQDATLLALEPAAGVVVEVLDDEGVAWARITSGVVEVDVTSRAFHAATNAGGSVPAALGEPDQPWVEVARDGRFQWFEHRLHPAALAVDPAVLSSNEPQDVASWSVPLRVDGDAVALEGRLRHVPVTGRLEPRLQDGRELAPGVVIEVAPGPVPAFFLRNDSDQPVTVLSREGSPYVVLDGRGARVNTASATWAEQPQAALFGAAGAAGGAGTDGPVYEHVSATPSHSWLDARAALPGVVPSVDVRASGREVTVREWSIPVQVGDELVTVRGELVWVPLAAQEAAETGVERLLPSVPLEYAVAALVGVVLLVVRVRRRQGTTAAPVDPSDPD